MGFNDVSPVLDARPSLKSLIISYVSSLHAAIERKVDMWNLKSMLSNTLKPFFLFNDTK